jgi:hypothetical protein
MALPVTKLLIGSPLGTPFSSVYSALNNGTLEPATTTQFVIADEYGNSIVFHGNFTVAAGEVTGGTATGYDVFAGATKTLKASGYSLDGAALFEAVQNYGINSQPFFDLVEGQAIKLVGSKLGDQFGGTDGGDVLLGKAGADFLFGWDGDDTIKGGKGDDFLQGDDGFDALTGNEGADVFAFQFDLLDPPPTSFDKIKDFEHGKDHIALTVFDGMGQLLPPWRTRKEVLPQGHRGRDRRPARHLRQENGQDLSGRRRRWRRRTVPIRQGDGRHQAPRRRLLLGVVDGRLNDGPGRSRPGLLYGASRQSTHFPSREDSTAAAMKRSVWAPSRTPGKSPASRFGVLPSFRATMASAASA